MKIAKNITTKSRLIDFLEFKKIKKSQFYKSTGLGNGFLDKNNNVNSDKIEIIASFYSDLNIEWLITGRGKMLRGEEPDAGPPAPIKLPTVEGTNLIAEIKQQAEQIGILKNENKHQNELIKKLNAENERLKNENGKLRSNVGERVHEKVPEVPHVPERLVNPRPTLRDRY
jgi:hypothetical protein